MVPSPRYNVALVVIDDVRADHLSAYGYDRKTSPFLDARIQEGTRFANCLTPTGWTLTSCASILTGQLPDTHGLVDHNRRFQKPKIGRFLGSVYHRVAFTNNGNTIPDSVDATQLELLGLKRRPAKWKFFGWDENFDDFIWTPREEHLEPFHDARAFLEGRREAEQPYFLFFHSNLVHDYHMDRDYYLEVADWLGRDIDPSLRAFRDGPWVWTDPPAGIEAGRLREEIIAKYDSGIRACDRLLEEIFRAIDFNDTIVIFVSDHGEGFDPDLGRVHHCGRLHQDLLHVPLVVWLPPGLKKRYALPQVETRFSSTIDIAPTILTLLGLGVEDFPGRALFDLSTHRRLECLDRGYLYWREDCQRESYDTARIEIRADVTYPLKSIEVRRNDEVKRYAYHLGQDPGERVNLLDQRDRDVKELEPVSFIVAVNDFEELEANLLASPVASSLRHEWILVDNRDNRLHDSIAALYYDAAEKAQNDLLFFMHQDLYLPTGWEENVARSLADLERKDPRWGVLGAVGAISAAENGESPKELRGHWCDPHGYHRLLPLPHEVESLDEQWLGLRRSRGLEFDPNLPGFHCYGIDLSLAARERGLRSYAIDAFVWHKFRDVKGHLITDKEDSPKIQDRWTPGFMELFNPSADFVERKWSKYLPFQTTSWSWK